MLVVGGKKGDNHICLKGKYILTKEKFDLDSITGESSVL